MEEVRVGATLIIVTIILALFGLLFWLKWRN